MDAASGGQMESSFKWLFYLFRLLRIVRLDVLKTKINKYLSNNCIDKQKSKKAKQKQIKK